jgi:hypothetical protein
MFLPHELDVLLKYNGFRNKTKFGSFEETAFEDSFRNSSLFDVWLKASHPGKTGLHKTIAKSFDEIVH